MKALADAKVIAERLIERGPLDEVAIVAAQFLRVIATVKLAIEHEAKDVEDSVKAEVDAVLGFLGFPAVYVGEKFAPTAYVPTAETDPVGAADEPRHAMLPGLKALTSEEIAALYAQGAAALDHTTPQEVLPGQATSQPDPVAAIVERIDGPTALALVKGTDPVVEGDRLVPVGEGEPQVVGH